MTSILRFDVLIFVIGADQLFQISVGNAPQKIFLESAVAFKIDCRLNHGIAT